MTQCKRCKTPFKPNRAFQIFCSGYCRVAHHRAVTNPVNVAATDPGMQLIAGGRMPGADALTGAGIPCWSWGSIVKAFGADSAELAACLKPSMDIRTNPVTESRVHR